MKHIEKEDKFLKTVEKITKAYYQNPKRFIGIAAAVVVGIVLIILFITRSGPKTSPEASLLFLEGLGRYTQNDTLGAEDIFRRLATKHFSTLEGQKAVFYLANLYYRERRFDEALKYFQKFYKSYSNRKSFLVPAALMGIGDCHVEMRDYRKAAEIYEEMFKKYKDYPLTPFALLNAARCYKELGMADKEEEMYKKIVENYPQHPLIEEAEAGLGALEVLRNKF